MNNKVRHTVFILCAVLLFTITANAGATKRQAHIHHSVKSARKHHKRAHRNVSAHALRKLVPPVVDTTCLDTTDLLHRTLITEINRWSGTRYHRGGLSLKGVDCSGFTSRVYRNALTLPLPRTSREQARIGRDIEEEELRFGDLLFFYSKVKPKHKRIGHVGIYIGDGNFVHSSRRRGVGIDSLSESYYAKRFACAKRVLPSDVISTDATTTEAE